MPCGTSSLARWTAMARCHNQQPARPSSLSRTGQEDACPDAPAPPRPPRTPKSSTLLTTLETPTNGRQIPSVPFLGILTGQKPGRLGTPAAGVSPAYTHSCISDTQLTGSLRADAHWGWQGMKEGESWARKTWGSIQSSFLSPRPSASATYLPKPESRLRRYPLSQP